jgi:hypothetical protein
MASGAGRGRITRRFWRGVFPAVVAGLLLVVAAYLYAPSIHGQANLNSLRSQIIFQFTASPKLFAFPVVLDRTIGLAVIDRPANNIGILEERGVTLAAPRLSADGERLLFVRVEPHRTSHELISCTVVSWRCRVLLRTEASIISPVELNARTILFASSPIITGTGGRKLYREHDFYLLNDGAAPDRLSHFRLFQLDSLNVLSDSIIFSASYPVEPDVVFPKFDPIAKSTSDIFKLQFEPSTFQIKAPTGILEPLYLLDEYSTKPAASPSGKRVAFLSRATANRRTKYNLALTTASGALLKYVELDGLAFSTPAFVDDTAMVNELLDDHYEIKLLRESNLPPEVIAKLDHSLASLAKLRRIPFVVEARRG